ncbi:hypothetical protein [Nannocystis pusilla]
MSASSGPATSTTTRPPASSATWRAALVPMLFLCRSCASSRLSE